MGQILKGAVRGDDVVVRWGGQEFLIILKLTDPQFVSGFAEKLITLVRDHRFHPEGEQAQEVKISLSVGYVAFPFYAGKPGRLSLQQALKLAGLALVQAREAGHDRAVGAVSGEVVPDQGQFASLLASLQYGVSEKLVRLE